MKSAICLGYYLAYQGKDRRVGRMYDTKKAAEEAKARVLRTLARKYQAPVAVLWEMDGKLKIEKVTTQYEQEPPK